MVQVVEVALVVFDKGQGLEAVGFVQVELVDAVALFAEQDVAVPQEFSFAEFVLFADAAAQGVEGVGGVLCCMRAPLFSTLTPTPCCCCTTTPNPSTTAATWALP